MAEAAMAIAATHGRKVEPCRFVVPARALQGFEPADFRTV